MKIQLQTFSTMALAVAATIWLGGCGGSAPKTTPSKSPTVVPSGGTHADSDKHGEDASHKEGEHKEAGHKEAGHKEGGHAEGHGHASEADMKAAAEKLTSYADAMHEIDELREQIEHLIESGKLADVHPPAQHISLIAKRLPELAKKSGIPQEHWKDINTQSRDLANTFDEIDEAADAGKKPETEAAFAKMVKLIDSLNVFTTKPGEGAKPEH